MRGEVIKPFRDKYHFNTLYEVGAVVDFTEERMKDLISRHLCKKLEGVIETSSPRKEANKKEQKKVLDEPVEDANLEKTKSEEAAAEKLAKAIGRPKKQ